MPSNRTTTAAVVIGLSLCASLAHAAATSQITCKPSANGKKSLSPETLGTPGDGILPEALVGIVSARFRFIDPVANGLEITRSTLTPLEAYGSGHPRGYAGGGPLNMNGPWQGLVWPFRDFNDGHAPVTGGSPPLGNDVGNFEQTSPNSYVVANMIGRMSFSPSSSASYDRGIPGNGGDDYARFFAVDVGSTSPIVRTVVVFLEGVEVDLLGRDTVTGQLRVVRTTAPNTSFSFEVPAPAATPLLLGLLALKRRNRRM